MTVYLCGASGSETGGITGAAGDQTGREVRKTKWDQYGGAGWTYVIRPQSGKAAEKIARAAEQGAANDNIGYDQTDRNDLLGKLERFGTMAKIAVKTECDCTSFAACCMIQAGFSKAKLYSGGNLPYSKNFDTKAMACGGVSKLTGDLYTKSPNHLKRGDILVCYGHHAEVVVTDGNSVKTGWHRDSRGWVYLEGGKPVKDAWRKDSHGWCWLGSDGYWMDRTKWLKCDGTWYHFTKGYMDHDGWFRDSHGWCWVGSNGKWAKAQWVEWKGSWYYVKPDGYMAADETLEIGTKRYRFDASGKWVG